MREKEDFANQFGLIPIRATWCAPSNIPSADLKQICRCDDGSEYAIKETEQDPRDPSQFIWTAHNEYFCYRLAHAVGITSPGHSLVQLPSGELAFGSRWESGATPTDWWDQIAAGTIPPANILPTLARIYAFDLFVHNVDRHAGNFLVRQQHFGFAVIAFDYSRSWSYHGIPPPPLPMKATDNTVLVQRQLTSLLGQYVSSASTADVLDNLEAVSTQTITSILSQQPDSWLTNTACQDIISWWSSPDRKIRLDAIRAGIQDGSHL
jgi:hypothetical protein